MGSLSPVLSPVLRPPNDPLSKNLRPFSIDTYKYTYTHTPTFNTHSKK